MKKIIFAAALAFVLCAVCALGASAVGYSDIPVVRISGSGRAVVTADRANLTFNLETSAKDSAGAKTENDKIYKIIIKTAGKYGEIKEEGAYIYTPDNGEPTTYNRTFSITTGKVGETAKIRDEVLSDGATGFSGVYYTLTDTAAAKSTAMEKALNDVTSRAGALGVKGSIRSVRELPYESNTDYSQSPEVTVEVRIMAEYVTPPPEQPTDKKDDKK